MRATADTFLCGGGDQEPLRPERALYREIAAALDAAISTQLVLGRPLRLPTERALCRMFGVSRVTIRGALRLLSETRCLQRRVGAGTFVGGPPTQGLAGGETRLTLAPGRLGCSADD
jgi:DNA-binding GntR family transcriptional regulator